MELSYAIGAEIGRRGMSLVCGGGDGIMENACRGCKEHGGTTIGIMKWNHGEDANPYIDYPIATSMDLARNNVIVWTASGLIAFEGRYGTSSEIGLCLDVGRPLIVTAPTPLYKETVLDTVSSRYRPTEDPQQAESIVEELLTLISRSNLLKDSRAL